MAKTPDFAKTFQDMMANFPIDTSSFQEAFKSQGVLGEKLARVALTVLVYQRTQSPLLSAVTFAISYLPWLLGGALLSTLADRFPRHRVLITSDVVRAVLTCALLRRRR